MTRKFTPALGREVELRDDNSDLEVWDATFNHLYHVPPPIDPPRTVLDLGANIGLTAAHYRAMWPDSEIHALEMDAACCDLIRHNAPDVYVHEGAVVGVDGDGFYDPTGWSSNFTFSRSQGTPVRTHTLSSLVKWFDDPVDFVKMDVEGAEWEIFEHGDWARRVNSLLVELHGDESDLVATGIDKLTRLGFHAVPHPPHPRAVWATR